MLMVGLTGGIACGKSTVAGVLKKYPDVLVVDTDYVAKTILLDTQSIPVLKSIFGEDVYCGGSLQISRIRDETFADAQKRLELEAFMHPLVWQHIVSLQSLLTESHILVVESAILYEVDWAEKFTVMVSVLCSEDTQIQRMKEHRNMTESDIRLRLNAQLSAAEKAKRADYVITTDDGEATIVHQVGYLMRSLRRKQRSMS